MNPNKSLCQTARLLCLTACLALPLGSARAEVKTEALFSDGLVLQQDVPVPVWGTAKDDEKVVVTLQEQTATVMATHGRWSVRLKPLKAGGPFTMTIAGENTITLHNVLVGEVWLCSGQSNMEFPLSRAANGAAAIAAATDSQLRLFTVPHGTADEPLSKVGGSWQECTPQTVTNFSAVAYFFGRDLRQARQVPVGLVHSSVGGTPAEAWTSQATLEADPELKPILERYAEAVKNFNPTEAAERYAQAKARYKEAAAKAKAEGTPAPKAPKAPRALADPRRANTRPSGLYNAMIAPLAPYALAGVIWYQGEANSARAAEYQHLFPAMIRDWRQAWGQGDFPFLFVQIAPMERMTPEIREAQLLSWKKVPHTAMAVTTDVGNELDIHPTSKEPVGARLALAARAVAYGEKIESSGPVFDSMKIENTRAVLSFTHVGKGLVARGGKLKGFTIATADGEFVPAKAQIEHNQVVVSSSSVSKPARVRYGWANTPEVNLFNADGLPASPFRTDPK